MMHPIFRGNIGNMAFFLTTWVHYKWFTGLAEDETDWSLLSFYSSLFSYVNSTDCLLLNGTGNRGFSIRVNILGKGSISLCTLWSNKIIEFSFKR